MNDSYCIKEKIYSGFKDGYDREFLYFTTIPATIFPKVDIFKVFDWEYVESCLLSKLDLANCEKYLRERKKYLTGQILLNKSSAGELIVKINTYLDQINNSKINELKMEEFDGTIKLPYKSKPFKSPWDTVKIQAEEDEKVFRILDEICVGSADQDKFKQELIIEQDLADLLIESSAANISHLYDELSKIKF